MAVKVKMSVDHNGSRVPKEDDSKPAHHSSAQKFGMLTKFMLPLVITQMVPDIAEQAINRGITSIASDDVVTLLASYGLAFYVSKLFTAITMELRHIGVVLVHSTDDHMIVVKLSLVLGVIFSLLLLVTGLSPLGTLIIRDLHGQSEEISDTTCTIMAYLSPTPLLEAFACYYEGGLIYHKRTGFAGLAKLVDFLMQVVFTITLLFTSTRTEPVLVPVFALYAGIIGRLVLVLGFWYILVGRRLPHRHPTEKPLTYTRSIWFWLPLVMVRLSQEMTRPAINLVVSKNLSNTSGVEEAAKAVAVLSAIYPIGRLMFSWLNDLRTVIPTFHKQSDQHEKFTMRTLTLYSAFCTATCFAVNVVLFLVPGVAYFIMQQIAGLDDELAGMCVIPLRIFSFICLCVGIRAHLTGVLIMMKRTIYLSPSALLGILGHILVLAMLPKTGLSGAVLGIVCLLLRMAVEFVLVAVPLLALILIKSNCARSTLCKSEDPELDTDEKLDTEEWSD